MISEQKFNERLGKRVFDMLKSNKKTSALIKKLGKVCTKFERDNVEKAIVLEGAYAGCVLSSLNQRGNYNKRLKEYVNNIEKTLEHNRYSDPDLYVAEIFNSVFK